MPLREAIRPEKLLGHQVVAADNGALEKEMALQWPYLPLHAYYTALNILATPE